MVLLTEQERLIGQEQQLINNTTSYSVPGSLGTVHDYGNITLASAGIIAFNFQVAITNNYSGLVYVRLKIGGTPCYAWNEGTSGSTSPHTDTVGTLVWLAAGTYDILLEGFNNTGYSANVQNFQAGLIVFNDCAASALASYSSGVSLTVNQRQTPIGPLACSVYCVQVFGSYPAGGGVNFQNPGESLSNPITVYADGVQQSWSERYQDIINAPGGSAKLFVALSVGTSHTITLNNTAGPTINVSVITCPWILMDGTGYTPVTLTFSQGSTLYVTLNPLFLDITKTVSVGNTRGVSFGSATDYYNASSGTGLMMYSYMVDVVDVNSVNVWVKGMGGCIEIVGADIR